MPAIITAARSLGRLLSLPVLLALALLSGSLLASATALAEEPGPQVKDKEVEVSVQATPTCEPEEGFDYQVTLHNAPGDTHWNNVAQWRAKGSGQHQTVYGDSGFVASGTGQFEIRAIAIQNVNGHFVERDASDWKGVDVRCDVLVPVPTDPKLTLDVEPVCDGEPGIKYELTLHNGPKTKQTYSVEWRKLLGPANTASGQSGFIATGEGKFKLEGQAAGLALGAETFTSKPQFVFVNCPPGEDGEPGGGNNPGGDDDIVQADPNFTG